MDIMYALGKVINENSRRASIHVPAFEFFGGVNESIDEFTCMMLDESFDIENDTLIGNQFLIEAVANRVGTSRIELIQENVFKNFIEKIKEFFRKVVAYIKGIIEKIKNYILQLKGNTTKWYDNMKEKINKNLNSSATMKDFSYEGWDWKLGELDNLLEKAKGLPSVGAEIDDDDVSIKNLPQYLKGVVKSTLVSAKKDKDGNDTDEIDHKETYKNTEKKIKEEMKSYREKLRAYVGLSGSKEVSMDEIKNKLSENVKGKTKKTFKGTTGLSQAMDFVKGAADKLSETKDSYAELEDIFTDTLTAIDDIDLSDDNEYKDTREYIQKILSGARDIASTNQSVFNTISSLNISLIKEYASDSMKVLSKVASLKKKD